MTGSGGPVLIANSALAVVCDIFGPTIAALTLGLYLQRQLPNRGSWRQVLGNKPLVAFGVSLMLFHLANAPLLPLVGQKLAQSHPTWATVLMSSCIVAAQLVMLPIALAAGAKAEAWGRKPILLAGFVILPIRALRYTASDHAA